MQNTSANNTILIAIVAVVALFGMVYLLQARDSDSRVANAMEEVADGIEDAGKELDPNRTTGEKIGDAVEDMGESIQDAAS